MGVLISGRGIPSLLARVKTEVTQQSGALPLTMSSSILFVMSEPTGNEWISSSQFWPLSRTISLYVPRGVAYAQDLAKKHFFGAGLDGPSELHSVPLIE